MYADISNIRKLLHILPILPVYFIIISVTFSFTYSYPLDPSTHSTTNTILSYLFYFFALMVIVSHSFAMFTNPGEVLKSGLINSKDKDSALYCKKCQSSRPERAHHCKTCRKCILKMDHHCPWVANCVGQNNQKYFVQFLFYATFGNMLAFIMLVAKVSAIDLYSIVNGIQPTATFTNIVYELRDPIISVMGSFFAFSMTVSIGFLFVIQIRNVLFNYTTVESHVYKASLDNPYYNTNKKENFKNIFGENIFMWMLPIQTNINQIKPQSVKYNKDSQYLSLTDIPLQQDSDDNVFINLNLQD